MQGGGGDEGRRGRRGDGEGRRRGRERRNTSIFQNVAPHCRGSTTGLGPIQIPGFACVLAPLVFAINK